MAQVVNTEKKSPAKPKLSNSTKQTSKMPPLFRKENYIIMVIGIVLVAMGYILLAGGKAPSDDIYSDAIFNTRRMVIAPTVMLIGLATSIVAIMWHPKKKNAEINKEATEQ
ncbi:MAG: DUF3098 domain-containing protein [Bacteroidales bacterium]|jgi:hypothetical protein|nr:DUF3098 domain-containing protein [Bacteroidales bacterium]